MADAHEAEKMINQSIDIQAQRAGGSKRKFLIISNNKVDATVIAHIGNAVDI